MTDKLEGYQSVPLDLEKEELYELMLMAHERDITLNQLVENLLREVIDRLENENS